MGYKKVNRVWVGFGKDEGKTREAKQVGSSGSGSTPADLHQMKIIAETDRREAQQQQQQTETTEYFVEHSSGEKVRISEGLANKIALDNIKNKAENPQNNYIKFKTLLESRTPPKTQTQRFIGEIGQSERALSSFAFGYTPDITEFRGEKYKTGTKFGKDNAPEQTIMYSSRVGGLNWEEAIRYGKTGEKNKDLVGKGLPVRFNPVGEVIKEGVEWEMENPLIASFTWGAGALFGAGSKGIELGVTKLVTKAPNLMKLAPLGKAGVFGIYGSMLGTAGFYSGKEIIGSDNKLKTLGEEGAKWITFGIGAKHGARLIEPKLNVALKQKARVFEEIGFNPNSKVSFTAQREIKSIRDFEIKLDTKAKTNYNTIWNTETRAGFPSKTNYFQTQLYPELKSTGKPLTKSRAPSIIEEAGSLARDVQIKTATKMYESEFNLGKQTYFKQKTLLDPYRSLRPSTKIQPPKQPRPRFILQTNLKNIGKKGSRYITRPSEALYVLNPSDNQLNFRISGAKFGNMPDIKPFGSAFANTFKGEGKTALFLGSIYGGDLKTGGDYSELMFKPNLIGEYDPLEIGKTKIKTNTDYDYKPPIVRFNMDFFQEQKQSIKQKTRQDLKLDIIPVSIFDFKPPKPLILKPPKIINEKKIRDPFRFSKPIVEIPQFTPRAYRVRSKRKGGFKIKPLDLDIFPVSDLFSTTLTELRTGKKATQRKKSKKSKKDFWEFIRSGSQIFPTSEIYSGKIKL